MKDFIKLSELKLQKSEMLEITGGVNTAKLFPPIRLYGIVITLYGIQPRQE